MFRVAGQPEHQFCLCVDARRDFGASLSSGCTTLATDFSWSPTTGDRHSCPGRQEPMRAARARAGVAAPDGKSCCVAAGKNRCSGVAESVCNVQFVAVDLGTWSTVSAGESQRVCRGVEVDKFVRALSELHQEQMEHIPGLRVVVEGSWSTIAGRKRQILQFSLEGSQARRRRPEVHSLLTGTLLVSVMALIESGGVSRRPGPGEAQGARRCAGAAGAHALGRRGVCFSGLSTKVLSVT